MKISNLKKNIVDFLIKVIKSEEYKHLRIVYVVAFVFSIIVTLFGAKGGGDTGSYFLAKDLIIKGSFDHFRTPLYPVFLAFTYKWSTTIFFQWLIFFVSIAYLYRTLENITISPRLIFISVIMYVCHPIFIYYQTQIIPEGLCISLCSILAYYLVAFIKTEKISYCWIFHIIILFLILLKPGCIFLLVISLTLLFYFIFTKRKLVLSYIFPFLLIFLFIGSYGFVIKKTYYVYSLSSVSDINLYWMFRERGKINVNLIKDDSVRNFVSNKVDIKYENSEEYIEEANTIFNRYGWKELHNVVQISLKMNLLDKKLLKIKNNLNGFVGKSIDNFGFRNSIRKYDYFTNCFPYFNFFTLIFLLLFYSILIAKHTYTVRSIPIISVLFLLCIAANFGSLILTAPNNYGRLIVPSISIILIVGVQCLEWFALFIRKKEKEFRLV